MAYKRQLSQLPIIPVNAKEHNVVCHYCIVGCGYKAYSWDTRYEGDGDRRRIDSGLISIPSRRQRRQAGMRRRCTTS